MNSSNKKSTDFHQQNRRSISSSYDYIIKLLLIGDSGVGKTSILFRFSEDSFVPTFITTLGIDFKIRTIDVDGKRVKIQVWDTSGQERFRTITTSYYRNAHGVMLVYDVSNETSFQNIKSWLSNLETNADAQIFKMLIGNKTDLDEMDGRVVTTKRGIDLAASINVPFFETSAKKDENIDKAFFTLARTVVQSIIDKQCDKPKTITLDSSTSTYSTFKNMKTACHC